MKLLKPSVAHKEFNFWHGRIEQTWITLRKREYLKRWQPKKPGVRRTSYLTFFEMEFTQPVFCVLNEMKTVKRTILEIIIERIEVSKFSKSEHQRMNAPDVATLPRVRHERHA